MEEILDIRQNKIRLIIKSLNLSKTVKDAAKKCGLSDRTLQRYMRNNGIRWVKEHKQYMLVRHDLKGEL